MSTAIHCDGPGCDEWVYTDTSESKDWIVVVDGGTRQHFCTGWHLTRWGAKNYEPENMNEHPSVTDLEQE